MFLALEHSSLSVNPVGDYTRPEGHASDNVYPSCVLYSATCPRLVCHQSNSTVRYGRIFPKPMRHREVRKPSFKVKTPTILSGYAIPVNLGETSGKKFGNLYGTIKLAARTFAKDVRSLSLEQGEGKGFGPFLPLYYHTAGQVQ